MKLATRPAFSSIPAVVLATLVVLATAQPSDAFAANRARAYAAYVNVPDAGVGDHYVCDSGWLPPSGGNQSATARNYSAGSVLIMDQGVAIASDDDDCDEDDLASVQIGHTIVFAGHAAELSFTSLNDDDDDDCCNPDDDDFTSAVIENLRFAGEPVVVTGLPNQVIDIPGVGQLIINEIVHADDDDCDDDDFTVNALHLTPATGGEVIIGSTIFDDDEDCCPLNDRGSSWGRIKTLYR